MQECNGRTDPRHGPGSHLGQKYRRSRGGQSEREECAGTGQLVYLASAHAK